jgi:hypothetical protein
MVNGGLTKRGEFHFVRHQLGLVKALTGDVPSQKGLVQFVAAYPFQNLSRLGISVLEGRNRRGPSESPIKTTTTVYVEDLLLKNPYTPPNKVRDSNYLIQCCSDIFSF